MNEILYSIIIPHKNTPDLLQRCLLSIPSRNDIEIIIVDDNSDPKLVNFDCFPGLDIENIKVVFTKESKGAGYARNIGIGHARGTWLLFADADDFFLDNFLSIIDQYKDADADIVFYNSTSVFSETLLPANRHSDIDSLINNYIKGIKGSTDKLRYMFYYPISKMLKRMMIIDNSILYDEIKVTNDVWFAVQSGHIARKILAEKKPIYCITVRSNSLSKTAGQDIFDLRVKTNLKVDKFMRKIGVQNSHYPMFLYILQSRKFGLRKIIQTIKLSIMNGSNIFLGVDKWLISKIKK